MTSPLTLAVSRDRAAWLAGDAGAWDRYLASLRAMQERQVGHDRPRPTRRVRRPRAPRAEA